MALSAIEIAAVIQEIEPALTGGWIQKISQPLPRAIQLDVRSFGKTLLLFISADPETARLHLLTRRYPNPPSPPPFCQFLRAHIQGARIEQVAQPPGERIVRFQLTTKEGPRALVAALIGRSADLLLLDSQERILFSLNAGREKAGEPYTPPAPLSHPSSEMADLVVPSSDRPALFPLSEAIERRYHQREHELVQARLRDARLAEVRKRIKKLTRLVDALRADLEKVSRYREYARYGELLKANLPALGKGQSQVTVIDYFDPTMPELVIPLDPAKGPQANMEDYFKKHRKYVAAEREIRPRLEHAERELDTLRAERAAIERGAWQPPPQPPLATTIRPRVPEQSRGNELQKRSGPFRRFTSADGLPIYVGRNARENEELTFRLAKSEDLWLHAQGVPGSHVVVRLEKGTEPPPETLRDAATLALLYSDLKKSGKGEVIYTRKRYVRKLKGKPPGTVMVTQEKRLFVTLDRARLDRIKQRQG